MILHFWGTYYLHIPSFFLLDSNILLRNQILILILFIILILNPKYCVITITSQLVKNQRIFSIFHLKMYFDCLKYHILYYKSQILRVKLQILFFSIQGGL
mmetsp:Transcript_11686/g.1040  ORF Transcript_11686/g.1040 Transcript_11686/m.1040 type:complete len:100 (-) Transcript_11686:545-844(-)